MLVPSIKLDGFDKRVNRMSEKKEKEWRGRGGLKRKRKRRSEEDEEEKEDEMEEEEERWGHFSNVLLKCKTSSTLALNVIVNEDRPLIIYTNTCNWFIQLFRML